MFIALYIRIARVLSRRSSLTSGISLLKTSLDLLRSFLQATETVSSIQEELASPYYSNTISVKRIQHPVKPRKTIYSSKFSQSALHRKLRRRHLQLKHPVLESLCPLVEEEEEEEAAIAGLTEDILTDLLVDGDLPVKEEAPAFETHLRTPLCQGRRRDLVCLSYRCQSLAFVPVELLDMLLVTLESRLVPELRAPMFSQQMGYTTLTSPAPGVSLRVSTKSWPSFTTIA